MATRMWLIHLGGLMALAVLLVLSLPFYEQRIPEVLEQHAREQLQAEGLDWVQVSANGRDLVISGKAPTPQAYQQAHQVLRTIKGVRSVTDELQSRLVSPYTFALDWREDKLHADGFVPDIDSQTHLQNLLDLHQTDVQDSEIRVRIANGDPPAWTEVLTTLLNALPNLQHARLDLVDQKFHLSGKTAHSQARDELITALKAYEEQGYKIDAHIVAADAIRLVSPYTFNLNWRDTRLSAEGFVPNDEGYRILLDKIGADFDADTSKVTLQVAKGQPEEWTELLIVLLDHLHDLEYAHVDVVDQQVHLSGKTAQSKTRDLLLQNFQRFDQHGYQLSLYIVAGDVAAQRCQRRFNELLTTSIAFQSGKAKINQKSFPLLERLAETAQLCPEVKVTVAGHTDNVGNAKKNQQLSQERAAEVAKWLVHAGVNEQRINTVGYGAARPIADNATPEGRAKNRRIEFIVQGNE